MIVLYTDELFAAHVTPEWHPEHAERTRAVLAGLEGLGCVARRERARAASLEDVLRVHDRDYVAAIEALAGRGGGELDPDTLVSPRTYEVALAASGTACAAVDAALAADAGDHAGRGFVVARPPGHHARPARAMGFCFFNHVAVAAARARAAGAGRIAIVDFDVHHGNGTQEIFWDDPGVLYASVHRARSFPGTGAADETGGERARGTTLNLPLMMSRTKRDDYKAAFSRVCDAVDAFRPDLILTSAGFDAWKDDPLGTLNLEAEDFAWIGERLRAVADASANGRLVSVLEGGYDLAALGDLVRAYLEGVSCAAGAPAQAETGADDLSPGSSQQAAVSC